MHLVTGGSGYFGEILVKKLLDKNFNVRVFDLNPFDGLEKNKIDMIIGDLRDKNAVEQACNGVTHIYHNVAQVPLAKNAELFHSVNVFGTENLLETALKLNVQKLVYTSSSAIYGVPKTNPVTELTPPSPGEKYGLAKLQGETLCKDFVKKGLNVSIIRPRTILGHGRLGIFQILFEWIYQGYNIPVLGNGSNIYQFIHAEDLADASILAAMEQDSDDYNIGASDYFSMRETLEQLAKYAGTHSKVRSTPFSFVEMLMKITEVLRMSPLAPYHSLMYGRSLYFDCAKAQKKLNWTPKYSTHRMFQESYDWYVSNRTRIFNQKQTSAHRSAVKQGILKLARFLP